MPFAARGMDLEIVILNELSQRKTAITRYITHIVKCKNDINELIYKTNILTGLENELMAAREKGGTLGRSCTHCYLKWITNKDL